MLSVEKNVYMARLAEQAERYEEMCAHMKEVALEMEPLGIDERNLLAVAFKNVTGARRSALRTIVGIEQRERELLHAGDRGAARRLRHAEAYRRRVEAELDEVSGVVLGLIDSRLVPSNPGLRTQQEQEDAEAQVFYQKMRADYHRYKAEAGSAEEHAALAEASYRAASKVAQTGLAPTHPVRLGLALNYAVFLYEVPQHSTEACERAKQAIDDAIAELDCAASLDAASYRDSTLIMQRLRDNLVLWGREGGAGARAEGATLHLARGPLT
ncbi:hypothetical protein EMIHUDRAFT_69971 [Emiliania huxleyi CCMP1516]|uniref:14-3-3 domain-containing protein n=3 Tax=Emiliania huxleyi TaxID=2903 RepID=A0A0D3KTY1_EMIH1|nr:14-3-3 protein [Emiliania huxleyi CCMP1516]XP_005791645.1 hypothetical protein EMIHUDRAFT_69971 [Emiliania huxleyi CCMP1516]EOD12348.1 14-3-3 protein [Emiliania huxleyi CCMP1516]EOD39216.1 hypothetical protein EMIHUDRAFT_69971 [Emiliania huxleyi CCMP1516]|mmetsp:Transcript_31477/g.104148  ORF Transcript_31477/g.104148 Transcript_31477/m.104148 type:complete len:270 (+) Transcript_31477:47-856(+)|eukprot:XP_005764777.1 14-3-3 protein [Emiliania huxleyi CCMP1516]